MAYDPFRAFETGRSIGKAKRSTFGMSTDTLAERDKERSGMMDKFGPILLKEQLERSRPVTELDQAKTDAYKGLANQREKSELSPSLQNQKDKRIQNIFDTLEGNKVKRQKIDKATGSLSKIPTGLAGKVQTAWMKNMDPNNPILTDWQQIKSVMTDAQLQSVAKTKGAISDREMELFAQAAANDDIMSVARMKPVLEAMKSALASSEESLLNSYRRIYPGEDPAQWPEMEGLIQPRADMAPDASTTSNDMKSDSRKRLEDKLKKRGYL